MPICEPDKRPAWLSCRRISSATLGKKAHFCDRHHIAGPTAVLVPASSTGTAYAVLTFDGSSRTQPRQRGASLRSYVVDWEHSGRRGDHPANGWAMGGDRGMVMSNVVSLALARERAWQSRGGSNGHAFKRQRCHHGILKSRGLMSGDSLSGSKPRIHSFDAVWWNSCSRFKHCAMAPEH
jgi:hypothetical protein